jgi:glucose/arabinose dehydrogenase
MDRKLIIVIVALAAALLACNLGGTAPGQAERPDKPIPTPTPTPAEEEPEESVMDAADEEAPPLEETVESTDPEAGAEEPADETGPSEGDQSAPPEPQPQGGGDDPAPSEQPAEQPPIDYSETVYFEASEGSAAALDELWDMVYDLPPGVPFSVTITEAQIEDKVNQAIAMSGYGEAISGSDVTFSNGQIGLTFALSTTIEATGRRVNATARVVFNVWVEGGEVMVSVASAEASGAIGSASIPPEMLTVLNEAVAAALNGTDYAAEAGADVTFTEIVISGGSMTLTGYVTPTV